MHHDTKVILCTNKHMHWSLDPASNGHANRGPPATVWFRCCNSQPALLLVVQRGKGEVNGAPIPRILLSGNSLLLAAAVNLLTRLIRPLHGFGAVHQDGYK